MSSTMTPGPVAGIDFGTCWSSVVVRRSDGSLVRVKEPVSGSPSVPSSVVLQVDGGLSWGTAAENVKRSRPYQSQFKRRWGESEPLLLGELGVTAVELVAGFVGWLRGLAEATVGEPLASVVATVPAAYEGHRRELMVHAMALAGFAEQAVRLEVEPVAAARFALADRPAVPGERLVIYDLGGGTFDVAVVEVLDDGGLVVLGHGGLPDVGGATFDRMIRDHVLARDDVGELAEALARSRRAWESDDPKEQARLLRPALELDDFCRRVKHQLSGAEVAEDWVPSCDVLFEMSRGELEALIGPALAETLECCEATVSDAGLGWGDIDRVVTVGGSSRVPAVAARLAERFGRPVQTVSDPELAVAEGAALPAAAAEVGRDRGPEPAARVSVGDAIRQQIGLRDATILSSLLDPGEFGGAAREEATPPSGEPGGPVPGPVAAFLADHPAGSTVTGTMTAEGTVDLVVAGVGVLSARLIGSTSGPVPAGSVRRVVVVGASAAGQLEVRLPDAPRREPVARRSSTSGSTGRSGSSATSEVVALRAVPGLPAPVTFALFLASDRVVVSDALHEKGPLISFCRLDGARVSLLRTTVVTGGSVRGGREGVHVTCLGRNSDLPGVVVGLSNGNIGQFTADGDQTRPFATTFGFTSHRIMAVAACGERALVHRDDGVALVEFRESNPRATVRRSFQLGAARPKMCAAGDLSWYVYGSKPQIRDGRDHRTRYALVASGPAVSFAVSEGDAEVAVVSAQAIEIFDPTNGTLTQTIDFEHDVLTRTAFIPSSDRLAVGTTEGRIVVIDRSGTHHAEYKFATVDKPVTTLQPSPDGRLLFAKAEAHSSGSFALIDLSSVGA